MNVGSRRAYVERLVVVRRKRSRDAELNISVGDRTVGCQDRANLQLTPIEHPGWLRSPDASTTLERSSVLESTREEK